MRDAECSYFGECGGCRFQDIEYEEQLENKRARLEEALKADSSFDPSNISVHSGDEFYYRTRVDMVIHSAGLGFRRKGVWYDALDIEHCVIANRRINELLKEVRDYFQDIDGFDLRAKKGTFRYAVIRAPRNSSSVSIVLNEHSPELDKAKSMVEGFAAVSSAENVLVTYMPSDRDLSISDSFTVVKGSDMLEESFLGRKFFYPAQGFFQNNFAMARRMQKYCSDILAGYDTQNAHLADIYAGVGTFGIINSDKFAAVTMIESFIPSVRVAQKNISLNGVRNAKIIGLDAKRFKVIEFDREQKLFVITDPPRSGMHPKTILRLNELRPEAIIYVSCNVEQLGGDLARFDGFRIKSAAMFDFFPQTPHSESVIELVPC